MDQFPALKTGAVLQYPAVTTVTFQTHRVQFVDGREQRFRQYAKKGRRWMVRLDRLDDGELSRLEEFFVSRQGRLTPFEFVDPWDNIAYQECHFETDSARMEFEELQHGKTVLWIRDKEN